MKTIAKIEKLQNAKFTVSKTIDLGNLGKAMSYYYYSDGRVLDKVYLGKIKRSYPCLDDENSELKI